MYMYTTCVYSLRVLLSGLFENALDFKHSESSSVWEKMFLPLSLNLGIRGKSGIILLGRDGHYLELVLIDTACISNGDILYIMGNISKMAEHIQVVIERVKAPSQKEQIHRYFTS